MKALYHTMEHLEKHTKNILLRVYILSTVTVTVYIHSIPVSISSFSSGSPFTTLRFSSDFKEL